MLVKTVSFSAVLGALLLHGTAIAGTVDPSQKAWFEKYKDQENVPQAANMLLNTDPEPNLKEGFGPLFNGTDLSQWEVKAGFAKFEVKDGMIIGRGLPKTPSTYLCTKKTDYTDFVFTCEMKWELDGNSGVMFRAQTKTAKGEEVVFGPQAEMEGITGDRFWSAGIYGQGCGGFYYPLWLTEHAKVRAALQKDGWNRLTIEAKGNVVKTWLNGVPASHWVGDGTYSKGFFGLQIHTGKPSVVMWRNLEIKELAAK